MRFSTMKSAAAVIALTGAAAGSGVGPALSLQVG
jgi:hypothetical protein